MKTDPIHSLLARSLSTAAAIALTSACHEESNGNGVDPIGAQPLLVDFALRTDLHLGSAHLGDL